MRSPKAAHGSMLLDVAGNGVEPRAAVEAMDIEWEEGFAIRVAADGDKVLISANRGGLLSLARQLAALATEQPGAHIHYDGYNALEEGSAELIIERAP